LNIIERRWWVRPYLRYYLRLDEDDRRSVLEDSPLSRHLATWKEELFKIGTVRFERHATLHRQVVEGGLEDVALVEVRFVVAGVSTNHAWRAWSSQFSSGVTKNVFVHESDRSRKPLFETGKIEPFGFANWTIRFCRFRWQSGAPPTLDDKASPPAKQRLDKGYARTTIKLEVKEAAKRSNWWKEKETRKLGQKI
jgi:hypothetical protein